MKRSKVQRVDTKKWKTHGRASPLTVTKWGVGLFPFSGRLPVVRLLFQAGLGFLPVGRLIVAVEARSL